MYKVRVGMKVLIIEDNPRLASRMEQQLKSWCVAESATSGDAGIRLAATHTFDIVLLDLGLPDSSGLEVCRQIRDLSSDLAILVVTGTDTVDSRVTLLENGADDYITKPFHMEELRARINALTRRRSRGEHTPVITVGDLVINPSKRTVTRAGQLITLRRKEFNILEYLALNPDRIVSRQNIVDYAWTSTSSGWAGSVDVHIKQLRDKIDRPFPHFQFIKTAYGVGYRLETPPPALNSPTLDPFTPDPPALGTEASPL